MIGVAESAAPNRDGIELIGLWAYSLPNSSSKYLSTPNMTFSGLKILTTSSLSNGERDLDKPQGIDRKKAQLVSSLVAYSSKACAFSVTKLQKSKNGFGLIFSSLASSLVSSGDFAYPIFSLGTF